MRTETTLKALEQELQRNCGDELAAAKTVGVSLIFVNTWRADDAEVNKRLTEAARVGAQGLVSAAIQRAVHGVEKGVYFKGTRVATEIDYSDGLLQTLLKAKIPEFAKDAEGGGVHVNVQVANVMPRANSYDEWLAMKDRTVNRALPAPRDEPMQPVVDAEYEVVQEPKPFKGIEL